MKTAIVLMGILFAAQALAEVRPGVYQGADSSGGACQFELGTTWFEDNIKHPLTERQPVLNVRFNALEVTPVIWNLGHLQVVDIEKGTARYEHSAFQQVVPRRDENFAGVTVIHLEIDETEREGGHLPKRLIYFEDNYRDAKKSVRIECTLP